MLLVLLVRPVILILASLRPRPCPTDMDAERVRFPSE
jgi:hypothetical protein